MVENYSTFKSFEWDNPTNLHVSLIISSVRTNYELMQEVIIWNGTPTYVTLYTSVTITPMITWNKTE